LFFAITENLPTSGSTDGSNGLTKKKINEIQI